MSPRFEDSEGRGDLSQPSREDRSRPSEGYRPQADRLVEEPDDGRPGGAEGLASGRRICREHERNWMDRVRDELEAWFGDEKADVRRRTDAASAGHLRDERRGDTGWNDHFSEPPPRRGRA